MPVIIPTKTDGTQAYNVTVPLEGVSFGFSFSWNARGSYWKVLVSDSSGSPLLSRVVRIGTLFFSRFRAMSPEKFPAGEIFALDTSNQDQDPSLTDLGTRVQLVYLSLAELKAAAAAA